MVFLNKRTNSSIFLIFFISACQIDNSVNLDDGPQKQVIDENIRFEKYLSNQWEQNLKDSPIFASLLGNKNFNQDMHILGNARNAKENRWLPSFVGNQPFGAVFSNKRCFILHLNEHMQNE